MAIENLWDHKCDIYHLAKATGVGIGFGVTTNSFSYPDTPDEADVPCHFKINPSASLTQTESVNEYIENGKVNLPAGTDVRVNDKIVWKENGLIYFAEIPKSIINMRTKEEHHIAVTIQRKGKVKGAI